MIKIRKSDSRGKTKLSWLNSNHSFSFGTYYNPNYKNFESLKVINEDIIEPDSGFAPHPHQNMEILTYVVNGTLTHKDSEGNGSTIRGDDVQLMSAGSGIVHSEYNISKKKPAHILQIWFLPDKLNTTPNYQQKSIDNAEKNNQFCLIASKQGRDNSLILNQDVDVYTALISRGQILNYKPRNNCKIWIQIIKGKVSLKDSILQSGDGASITDEKKIEFTALRNTELLIFDLKPLET